MRKTFRNLLIGASASVLGAGAAQAAPSLFAGNGHYYDYVSNSLTFDDALAASAASSHLGLQGYLATVTSADEQTFIYDNVTKAATWFAGTDRETEGTWKWVAGPEAGTIFYSGGAPIGYSNWNAGEPNNLGDEDYLWGNWSGSAWNDIAWTSLGYVVEYSAVPEPASWAMMIGGLGLVGATMRRRRTAVRFA
jgi:hypothetical protein